MDKVEPGSYIQDNRDGRNNIDIKNYIISDMY